MMLLLPMMQLLLRCEVRWILVVLLRCADLDDTVEKDILMRCTCMDDGAHDVTDTIDC